MKIINLIKQKKLVEETSNEYSAADQIDSTFRDLKQIDREALLKKFR